MNHVNLNKSRSAQRGQVVLLLIVTLLLGAAAIFYGLTTATPPEIERDRKTAAALALAKAALIGYAVSVNLSTTSSSVRPGDLPCPDTDDDGSAETSCGNGAGTTGQANRIGRFPWKSLGLTDLRDGDGERLWYAVSTNFKNNTRRPCTASGQAGCLNSDTLGTITIRDTAGNIVNNAANVDPAASGVIAVIFSPGAILRRQDGILQNRTCVGGAGCTAAGVCNATTTPKCDPTNYLDVVTGVEDNADFTDGNATNGFINGIVRDSSGNIILNDRLISITYQDLIPLLEQRVAMEILNCLNLYAAANTGRYPWANRVADYPNTDDKNNTLFGRVPDTLSDTSNSSKIKGNPTMSDTWPSTCVQQGAWWNNWREHVFYGIADAYKPGTGTLSGCGAPGSCLSVNPPSATANKQVVVLVSRSRLSGQSRSSNSDKRDLANYLEGENNNSDSLFTKQSSNTTFNDTVIFYSP